MFKLRWTQPRRLEPAIVILHTKFPPKSVVRYLLHRT